MVNNIEQVGENNMPSNQSIASLAQRAANHVLHRPITASCAAPQTQEEEVVLRIKGFEPSLVDSQVWIQRG